MQQVWTNGACIEVGLWLNIHMGLGARPPGDKILIWDAGVSHLSVPKGTVRDCRLSLRHGRCTSWGCTIVRWDDGACEICPAVNKSVFVVHECHSNDASVDSDQLAFICGRHGVHHDMAPIALLQLHAI
jgi:hypothetical protein